MTDSRVRILSREAMAGWIPPPRLSLSQWADENFYLSPESSAEPGRWTTIPYQKGILDAITDPMVERISFMKSARVGATKMMCVAIAFHMEHDPCAMMLVQPTIEDAQGFSKEEIAPMLRDVPALSGLVRDGAKTADDTILQKLFPGGSLSLVGANSGRGFRRVSRRIVLFDETDAYPPSAGSEGDQLKLGIRRTETFWNRKIFAASTPLIAGASRIAEMFDQGDQRRYYVPCPRCGHMAPLVFRGDGGHAMTWPEGKPEEAFFTCQKNGCAIEHRSKRDMVAAGEWRAAAPFKGHASFHIWAAYSYSPNATWGQLAKEFVEASAGGPDKLKTFVNTVLGETWIEKGEAPDWLRLYHRREHYERGVVPRGVLLITAGVDVQRDRLVWEVVGWGDDLQSWSIDASVIPGKTAEEEVWSQLDELLSQGWPGEDGLEYSINKLAVDSGDQTQIVYNWGRKHPMSRVIACKGVATAKTLIGAPSTVDIDFRGKKIARGYKVWPVAPAIAKGELYGWLELERPTAESGLPFPSGYCHFPEYGEDYFKQLTAEHLVRKVMRRTGFVTMEWQILPGRENHWLDCRVYARAAACLAGIDRHAAAKRVKHARQASPPPAPPPRISEVVRSEPPKESPIPRRARSVGGGWLGRGRGGSWLRKRR